MTSSTSVNSSSVNSTSVNSTSVNATSAVVAPSIAWCPTAVGLEYTTDWLGGSYAAVRSWSHLDALAHQVGLLAARYLVVQRSNDPGQRFAQCVSAGDHAVVEVGALDAESGQHSVWRLHHNGHGGAVPEPQQFMRIARDWLFVGVVPDYAATAVPLDGNDEPF